MKPHGSPRKPPADISRLVAVLQNEFGQDAAVSGAEGFMISAVNDWIDGGPLLNPILGDPVKGLPCGFYAEVYGHESSGKSTLSYYLLGQAQKSGAIPVLADIEVSYDAKWAEKQGVNSAGLVRLASAYLDAKGKFIVDDLDREFQKWAFTLNKSWRMFHRPHLLVVDSLAALIPREIMEGDYGDRTIGAMARAMSINLRKFHSVLLKTKTACIFINQLRSKIGVMFGEKEQTSGGKAKNFYFFSRVEVAKIKTLKKGSSPVGITSRIRNKKNKLSVPFRSTEFTISFTKGIQV